MFIMQYSLVDFLVSTDTSVQNLFLFSDFYSN